MNDVKAVCVVIRKGNLVLAVETKDRRGELSLPGGFVDEGASPLKAAEREVLEETGLIVRLDPQPLHVGAADDSGIAVATYLAKSSKGTVQAGDDAVAASWVTWQKLVDPRNRFASYNYRVYEAFLNCV